ncbi:MAG: transposase [Thermodesulfovibrionales bacterium]|nr:transposase [Thermodesulfovibrionales bacterium]
MARPLRIEYEGAVYHIIARGNRGDYIFVKDEDKEVFLDILGRSVDRYGMDIYAWCVMGNHYHLLASVPHGNLSRAMHFIGSGYGSYLGRFRGFIGHVFAGRYKSLCVEKEGYLLELSRYIHLNPVRAAIVKTAEEYRWSSYRQYIGEERAHSWLQKEWLLSEYGATEKTARKKYREFVDAGMKEPPQNPEEKIIGQAVLGSERFVQAVVKSLKGKDKLGDIVAKRCFSRTPGVDEICRAVCGYYGINELKGSKAEDMFVCVAKEESHALNREIAEKIGGKSTSAIAHQYRRVMGKIGENRKSWRQFEKEKADILSLFKG